MLVKLKKNFKFFTFIFLILFCFVFKISNVDAMVYKDRVSTQFNASTKQGYFATANTSNGLPYYLESWVAFEFTNNFPIQNTDYLLFQFVREEYNLFEGENNFCSKYIQTTDSSTNVISNITCDPSTYTSSYNIENNLNKSMFVRYTDNSIDYCWFDSTMQGYAVCPNGKKEIDSFWMHYTGTYRRVEYRLQLSTIIYLYNNDSTEIVNGLSGIQQQQVSTTTTIQNFNNYVSNTDTTEAETNQTTALGGISDTFNTHMSKANELTQFFLIPINFMVNIQNNTCKPLVWDIPFVNTRVQIPCMSTIYNSYFSTFISVFSLIMTSLLGYRSMLKLFNAIKGMVDAEDDKVEVVDL